MENTESKLWYYSQSGSYFFFFDRLFSQILKSNVSEIYRIDSLRQYVFVSS